MDATALSRAEREDLERRLRERLRELRGAVKAQLSGSDDPTVVGLANRLADNDDWAVADALSEQDIAFASRDLAELAKVEAALRRVADGSYGVCSDCGEPIPYARLAIAPWATRCVACQEVRERRVGNGA